MNDWIRSFVFRELFDNICVLIFVLFSENWDKLWVFKLFIGLFWGVMKSFNFIVLMLNMRLSVVYVLLSELSLGFKLIKG